MSPLKMPIAIRAYSERPGRQPLGARPRSSDPHASPWTLIFDCETTIDATQQLRIGFYQVRKGERLHDNGVFYEPTAITESELESLRSYAAARNLTLMEVAGFRTDIFLKYGYTRCGTVVGFNLPFDLSRLAIGHGPARRHMRGGFSFELTPNRDDPRVRVKHLSPRAALIDFAKPGDQETSRGMRKRGIYVPTYRGHFVDLKTLAAALLSRRFSLQSLAAHLGTKTQKLATDEHGSLTADYLEYARTDVQATWECYLELSRRYAEHGLSKGMDRLLSEASIGKAYLQEMGIKPLLGCYPEYSRQRFGEIFCAYYGGRAEVRNRRVIREVMYCDFKSMYPTVNSLMGLWDFVIAEEMEIADSTAPTREFLEAVTLEDLQHPGTWRQLRTLVRLKPNADILPVRAKYDGRTHTIGLNYLSSSESLWYTLADCIVSKLLSGKTPQIEKALTYWPGPPQQNLEPINILGRKDYRIDPENQDLFSRLIDLRDEAKANRDEIEKTLKILANSTSYGIFIEVNRNDAPKSEKLSVYGPDGKCAHIGAKAIEEPGRFFHPLLGVLITGAARLMLGIAEKRTMDLGLDWAFCDTDSLAMVRPKNVSRRSFRRKATQLIDWFRPLNPYRKSGSILKLEDINCGIGSEELEPLFCFAISAKRYALFNLDADGIPVLRKASAHGLGQLLDPYEETEAPKDRPGPQVPLSEIGVKRWHHDLWITIVQAALDGYPDQVAYDWHPALSLPAVLRYSASSPQLLNWLAAWNDGKHYDQQVRPFGFLLSYTAKSGVFAPTCNSALVDGPRRGRPPSTNAPKPIAPYDSDHDRALFAVFNRVAGEHIEADQLKTYSEALAQYHLSCEEKFENGRFLDRGRTERRHVIANEFVLIGKEANRVGESGEADPLASSMPIWGTRTHPDPTVNVRESGQHH